ncbi:hypothetical protein O7626_19110 [Micromonospora sp. WMMD1102]|uniref:alpha/beta hydrolase n=1 Tax=Micromonospora sp. WMMD1102 TaxID=3016105 RepID=UPI0024155CF6|nr:hypothetical protein [Micromonospora sp. WMMD1102]MDG4788023.1 hypothetical protein [Micromonospora sp. WMMD1102]
MTVPQVPPTQHSGVVEEFCLLDGGPYPLFSVLSVPADWSGGTGVLLLPGAGISSVGNARVWVDVARELAAHGSLALRLDVHGVGESGGTADPADPLRPPTADACAAARRVRERGGTDLVIVGECFGARTALDCVGRVDGLRGLVLLVPPLGTARPGTPGYAAETVDLLDKLEAAVRSGVRVVVAYGPDDTDREPFLSAVTERFGTGFPRALPALLIHSATTKIHGIASVEARMAVGELVVEAVASSVPPTPPSARS